MEKPIITVENKGTDGKKDPTTEKEGTATEGPKPEQKPQDFTLTASGLLNVASATFPNNFYFNVGGKKYYCNVLYAIFISPIIAKLYAENPKIDHFDIDIPDKSNYFQIIMDIMYGEEVTVNPIQNNFVRAFGEILGNQEIIDAFKPIEREEITSKEAISILTDEEKNTVIKIQHNQLVEVIAQGFYTLTAEDLMPLNLETLVEILNNSELSIYNEKTLSDIIIELIKQKGDSYRCLLAYIGYHNLDAETMKEFTQIIRPDDVTPQLWEALSERMSLKVKSTPMKNRYIINEIPIPFKKKPLDGIFTYLRNKAKGVNPVDAKLVSVYAKEEGNIDAKELLNYGTKPRWSLPEKEDNTLTFDFLKGQFALSGYTITSGSSSSYWEYPVSFTWEGSDDQTSWEAIDVRTKNTDLGKNEATHTWTCPISRLYRYIRFRLRDVERSGGLFCREFELFGSYREPKE